MLWVLLVPQIRRLNLGLAGCLRLAKTLVAPSDVILENCVRQRQLVLMSLTLSLSGLVAPKNLRRTISFPQRTKQPGPSGNTPTLNELTLSDLSRRGARLEGGPQRAGLPIRFHDLRYTCITTNGQYPPDCR